MDYNQWLDITATIHIIQNKYELGDYLGCAWGLEFWDKENGYKSNPTMMVSESITVYISHFIKYIDLKNNYIKYGKSIDDLIDYFHELVCTHLNKETLNEKTIIRYHDNDSVVFLREINKKYVK